MNRLLAMSSSSDDITTKPFRAFTRSPRLCVITASNLLYLIHREKERQQIMAKKLSKHRKEKNNNNEKEAKEKDGEKTT